METIALNKLKKGKSKEQQKVLDYFLKKGCFAGTMKDKEYLSMVTARREYLNAKQTALNKIGLDESELKEIPPAQLEGFVFDNVYVKKQKDGKWVSSTYQVAWVFCSSTQLYIYRCSFNMDDSKKNESTDEFFYKDVTSVSTSTDTKEGKNEDKYGKKMEVTTNRLCMVVPGDKIYIALDEVPNSEGIIQALKQKLREKKTS